MAAATPITADDELPRPSTGEPAFSDGLTFAFGDAAAGLHGVVRVGRAGGTASGLAIVHLDGTPELVRLEGGVPLLRDPPERLDAVGAAGIDHEILEPLRRWTVSVAAEDGSLDLEVEAEGEPDAVPEGSPLHRAGGSRGYEQFCRVRGSANVAGRRLRIDGRGQRGHQWGAPDWSAIALSRTVSGWFADGTAFTLSAIRPDGASSHADEVVRAALWDPEAGGMVVDEAPRLSTTLDDELRHPRASLELWAGDEGPVWRASGEAVAGTALDLGRLRLQTAAYRWRMDGVEGVGRYDVLRRVDAAAADDDARSGGEPGQLSPPRRSQQ